MGFPTVIRPGTWIKGKPDLTGQVDTFQNYYLEACYALICFERTQVGDIETRSAREIEEPMMKRDIIRALTNGEYMMAQSLEMEIEASKICQNTLLQQGRLPLAIERQADVIYAKSFLFALDGYAKMVKAMSKDLASEALANVYDDFTNHKFPNLVDIRNSAHHIEDRIRMKAPYGKDIEPKPYEGEGIFSGMKGVKIYAVNNLMGNRYSTSIVDGTIAEIEVSLRSLELFSESLHRAFAAFDWEGPASVLT